MEHWGNYYEDFLEAREREHRAESARMTMIKEEEETNHAGQFATKRRALQYAKRETRNTKMRHRVTLATTYRALVPRLCWYVHIDARYNADGGIN